MHELLEGLNILASDYLHEDTVSGRLLSRGDRTLQDAVKIMCGVEDATEELTKDVFLETVRKCIKFRSTLPEPSAKTDPELYDRYCTLTQNVLSFAKHTAAQQPSGRKPVIPSWSSSPTNSQIHRISASPSPQCQTLIGSADSFYEGTSRAPSSSALRHVELSTMAMSLSRKSAKSAKTTKTTKSGVPASVYPHAPHPSQQPVCTSPYHGIFNTCPCTPGALRLNSTPDSDTDTDDEDAVVVSPASTLPTIPSLSNTPRHSDSPLASLVRTLATLKRAISKRASTNGNGNCRDKSHPIHSVRPSVLIPKNGDEIRITVETVRDPPRTPIGHVPVQTHVDQDQEHRDDQEEKDDSEQEDGASVRWYKLVEVPPTRTPSRAGIDVEAADVRIRASKALRIRSSPPPRPASTDGIARAGGRRTLHLQDPHLAGRGTATSPPSRSGSPTVHHHPHLPSPLNTHHHPHSHSRSASANLPTTTPRGRADDLFRSHSLRRTVSSRYGITGITSGLVSRSSSTRSRTPDEVGHMFGSDDEVEAGANMVPIRGVSSLPAPTPTLAPLGAPAMIRSTTLKLPIVSPSPARAYPSPMITPRRGPPAPLPLDLPLVPSNSDSDSRTPGVQTPCAWTPGGHVQLPPSRRPSIKRDQRDKDKTLPQTPVLKDGDKTWI